MHSGVPLWGQSLLLKEKVKCKRQSKLLDDYKNQLMKNILSDRMGLFILRDGTSGQRMILASLDLSLGDSSDWGYWRELSVPAHGQHPFLEVLLKVKLEERQYIAISFLVLRWLPYGQIIFMLLGLIWKIKVLCKPGHLAGPHHPALKSLFQVYFMGHFLHSMPESNT